MPSTVNRGQPVAEYNRIIHDTLGEAVSRYFGAQSVSVLGSQEFKFPNTRCCAREQRIVKHKHMSPQTARACTSTRAFLKSMQFSFEIDVYLQVLTTIVSIGVKIYTGSAGGTFSLNATRGQTA